MKNKSLKRIAISFLLVCMMVLSACTAFVGCTPTPDPEPPEANLVKIELDTSAVKKEFAFGETFTYDGLKVKAIMDDDTTKDVALTDCRVSTPSTELAGKRSVSVTYQGKNARYEITVKPRVYPEISATSLLDIAEENDSKAFRVEAEAMDLKAVNKENGVASLVAEAPEEAEITSGGKYITGFGVKYNYFGFKFTAAKQFENVTLVMRLANSDKENIADIADHMKIFLNRAETEEDGVTGEITKQANLDAGVCKWVDVVIRGLTVREGDNFITFDIAGEKVPDIDYLDFYVGMRYISSVVNLAEVTEAPLMVDLEDFDTEKASTRQDWADANPDKIVNGLGLETVTKESPGKTTSRGTSVAALNAGSELSTTIRLAENATLKIGFVGASASSYVVKDKWEFYIDGYKLLFVDATDIRGGNPGAGEYWDWINVNLGAYNIPAGDHFFAVKNVGGSCNIDGLTFEVLTMGGEYHSDGVDLDNQEEFMPHACGHVCLVCGKCQDATCEHTDCSEKCHGCVVMEAENMSKEGVVTRPDFEGALGKGNYAAVADDKASGGQRTYGFGAGTVFTVKVTATEDCTIDIFVRLFSDKTETFGQNFEFTMDGAPLTQANPDETMTPNGTFKSVCVAQGVELTAGVHIFTMKVVASHFDFDCVGFSSTTAATTPVTVSQPDPAPAHTCEHVCTVETCGKCTDAACTDPVCADKCSGHTEQGETTEPEENS